MTNAHWLVALGALAFLYPVLRRWQLERARPIRVRLVELGRDMLSSPQYTDGQKVLIANLLEDAFDWRFMVRAAFAFPIVVWKVIFKGLYKDDALMEDIRFRELIDLHFRSTTVANPLCALIVRLELALAVVFVASALIAPYLIAELAAMIAPNSRRQLRPAA